MVLLGVRTVTRGVAPREGTVCPQVLKHGEDPLSKSSRVEDPSALSETYQLFSIPRSHAIRRTS